MNFHSKHAGYSLLEISLTIMLLVLLAGVAVPLASGWIEEQRMRRVAAELIEDVQFAKIGTERSGRAETIRIVAPGDAANKQASSDSETLFVPPAGYSFILSQPRSEIEPVGIRVNRHGFVEPVRVRIEKNDSWLEFSFDFLSGHVRDETYSF